MSQGQTRQDFVNWVSSNENAAYIQTGADGWNRWANSVWPQLISRLHEHEYQMWLSSGDTPQLRNMIRFSCGLPGVGTGTQDFTGAKQRMGDAYRGYLAIAQNVLNASNSELVSLQKQLAAATDPAVQQSLQLQIKVQQNTIDAETANVATWKKTLADALQSGQVT